MHQPSCNSTETIQGSSLLQQARPSIKEDQNMQQIWEIFGDSSAVKDALSKTAIVLGMISLSVTGSFAYKKAAALTDWAPLYFSLGGAAWLLSATCFVALL